MITKEVEISPRTRGRSYRFEQDLNKNRLAVRTDEALDAVIRLAAYKLKRIGRKEEADRLIMEWESQFHGYLPAMVGMRGIGDHKPLSSWLAQKYEMLEFILGKEVCYTLRLSDIKTINFAIPVVFKCVDNVDEPEYYRHFVYDEEYHYRGLAPVVSYWVTEFSCCGFLWTNTILCTPIAMGVEWLVKSQVAPRLNEPLWKRACKQ